MSRSIFVVVLAVLTVFAAPVAADDAGTNQGFSEADRQIMKGDNLYYDGDYYRALSAYKDFLWDYSDDPRADRVRLKMAWVYYAAGEHRDAARVLDRLAEERAEDQTGLWARQYLGEVARDANRLSLARNSFEGLLDLCRPRLEEADEETIDPDVDNCLELTARARLALADVQAASHNFETAVEHLEKMPAYNGWDEEAREIADINRNLSVPSKSPALAGTLSIIPGVGHMYIGEWRNGLLAMLWNGIFIYGIVDSVMAGRIGQAVVIGLLETIWYSGTIFGAVSGAHRYNRDAKRIVEDGIRGDIDRITSDDPWPTRFPTENPTYLELELEF